MQLRKDFISNKSQKWTGRKLNYQYITIHNTGNPKSTAKGERYWLENPSNTSKTGYHIVIDEYEAIQTMPLDMIANHSGDRKGNATSIGIEICESGDYNQTILNAIDIVSQLLKEKGWGVDKLKQHYDWSGKDCPKLIRNGYLGWTWEKFKSEIDKKLKPTPQPKPTQTKSPTQILFDKRIISTLEWNDWLNKDQYIQSEYMKSLIINFYLFFSGEKDFLKAMSFIADKKLISDKTWWLDKLSRPQEIESKWCKILVDRMSCFIDSRGNNC